MIFFFDGRGLDATINKASFCPEVLNLHAPMIFWINRWFTYQIKAKSSKMRQIHFNKSRFWATGRKHQEVRRGGGGQSNSAPSQITQRRLLWWFRFFDTWRPLIRPLLWLRAAIRPVVVDECWWGWKSFVVFQFTVHLSHWLTSICITKRPGEPSVCPLGPCLLVCVCCECICDFCAQTLLKKKILPVRRKKERILLTMQHLREVLTYKSITVEPEVHYWSEMTFDTMSYRWEKKLEIWR